MIACSVGAMSATNRPNSEGFIWPMVLLDCSVAGLRPAGRIGALIGFSSLRGAVCRVGAAGQVEATRSDPCEASFLLSPSSKSPNGIYSASSARAKCSGHALPVSGKLAIARIAPGAALEAVKVGRGPRGRPCISGPAVPSRRRTRSEADHNKRRHGNEEKAGHETVLWLR